MSSPLKPLNGDAARATPARKEEAAAAAQALRAGSETPLASGAAPASANKRKRATEPDNLRAWSKDTRGAPPGPAFVTPFKDDKSAAPGGRKRACTGICRSFWPSTCTGVAHRPLAALPQPDELALARATLRSARAAAEEAAAAEAAAAAAVPADVAALLSGLSLSSYGAALCGTLGVKCVADLCYVTKKMLRKHLPALLPVERAKLLKAAARAAVKSRRSKRSAATKSSPCDLMLSYRVPHTGHGGDSSAFELQAGLERLGYSFFIAETAIEGGDSWPSTIQQAVEDCKAVVVLSSPDYGNEDQSPWTKRELELAANLKKPLIPVWHSGPYPPPAVQIYLSGVQRIPSGNFAKGYVSAGISHEAVVKQLAKALKRKGIFPSSPPTQSA